MAKSTATVKAWALVLQGQSIHQVPYTGRDQEGLLCYCHEGDKEWTRGATVVTELVNNPRNRSDSEAAA